MPTDPVFVWWTAARTPGLRWEAMTDDERARSQGIRRARDRELYALGCALIRLVAARALGCAPSDLRFDRRCPECGGPHGRPHLAGDIGDTRVELSLSHTRSHLVCALAPGMPVGVDVEDGGGLTRADLVAQRILAPGEAAVYRRLPATRRRDALLTYWTRKEAVLKAMGKGMRVPMRTLIVSDPDAEPRVVGWSTGSGSNRIALRTLRGPGGAGSFPEAALAVTGVTDIRLAERDASALPWRRIRTE